MFLWKRKLCQAKLYKQPHLPVFNPSRKHWLIAFHWVWSSTDSFWSENNRDISLLPCSPTGNFQFPWILSPDHYLLCFHSIYSLPMMPTKNLTVDDLEHFSPKHAFAPLFSECWLPKARLLLSCIHLNHIGFCYHEWIIVTKRHYSCSEKC